MSADAFMPALSPSTAPGTRSFGVGVGVTVATTGNLQALTGPAGGTDFTLLLTNLGTTAVAFVFGTANVTCTASAGTNPGVPLLPNANLVVAVPHDATHIYLIAESGTPRVQINPGFGGI